MVVKIGGSTLGKRDTTLEDLVELQKQGLSIVVVHGGAQTASDWLSRLGIPTRFIRGLRVTDAESLKVVTAVYSGLVNKELVVGIGSLGGRAVGLSGSDGDLLQATIKNPELGYVGQIVKVDPAPLSLLLEKGYMPVIAPISAGIVDDKMTLLNVNGDTVAGEIAAALAAEKLVFLTDVDGVHDDSGRVVPRLTVPEAKSLLESGAATGGMIPKIEGCLKALTTVPITRIVDGRVPHVLVKEMNTEIGGTSIVPE